MASRFEKASQGWRGSWGQSLANLPAAATLLAVSSMRVFRVLAMLLTGVAVAAPFPGGRAAEPPARTELKYPPARRDSTADTYFGTRVPAPYQWMENFDSPAVQQWVGVENRLTFAYLDKIPVRHWIKERLTALWNYARESTPELVAGGRIFFSKNSGLQNQSVGTSRIRPTPHPAKCWIPTSCRRTARWRCSVRALAARDLPRHNLSQGGSDWLTIHVRNVANGQDLPDTIRWVKFSGVSWTEDEKGFFYSRYPEPPAGKAISQRVINQKLYYHRLETSRARMP